VKQPLIFAATYTRDFTALGGPDNPAQTKHLRAALNLVAVANMEGDTPGDLFARLQGVDRVYPESDLVSLQGEDGSIAVWEKPADDGLVPTLKVLAIEAVPTPFVPGYWKEVELGDQAKVSGGSGGDGVNRPKFIFWGSWKTRQVDECAIQVSTPPYSNDQSFVEFWSGLKQANGRRLVDFSLSLSKEQTFYLVRFLMGILAGAKAKAPAKTARLTELKLGDEIEHPKYGRLRYIGRKIDEAGRPDPDEFRFKTVPSWEGDKPVEVKLGPTYQRFELI
jgi:hypothetical protein